MGGGIFANLILIRVPMKKILKLSLVLAGMSVLYLPLCVVNHFQELPWYDMYFVVSVILSLALFSMLLHKTSRNSRLKWPLMCLVCEGIVGVFSYICLFYIMTHPVVDRETFELVAPWYDWNEVAYILQLLFSCVGMIWFGTFFRRRSAVRISAFLIPVVLVTGFLWGRMIGASFSPELSESQIERLVNQIRIVSLVVNLTLNILYAIFYYSFYKYNKTYGMGWKNEIF